MYHIDNKSIEDKQLFITSSFSNYFLDSFYYCVFDKVIQSYSNYLMISDNTLLLAKNNILGKKSNRSIGCIRTDCLMQSYYHLFIRQLKTGGIIRVISNTTNSFTRY